MLFLKYFFLQIQRSKIHLQTILIKKVNQYLYNTSELRVVLKTFHYDFYIIYFISRALIQHIL